MKQCRMCEYRFQLKNTVPIDGLCHRCHMSLCQEKFGECVKCAKLIDNMINFLYPTPDEENEQG